MRKFLPTYSGCFVCGKNNLSGLKLRFEVSGEEVVTKATFSKEHEGFKGIAHGGVVTAVIDEAMGWASTIKTRLLYVTAELNVRFVKPVPINEELTFKAKMVEDKKKISINEGIALDSKGETLVKASGKFFAITQEENKKVIDYLAFDEDTYDAFKEAPPTLPASDKPLYCQKNNRDIPIDRVKCPTPKDYCPTRGGCIIYLISKGKLPL